MREMKLVPYDPNWVNQYQMIEKELKKAFQSIRVDIFHIGSTSIKNMPAKPILDVLVVFDSFKDCEKSLESLKSLGYVDKKENGIRGRRYFQKFHEDGVNHIAHLHCYEKNSDEIYHHLLFKKYLSTNPEAFQKYLNVKIEASNLYFKSSLLYTEHKSKCIQEILKEAKQVFSKDDTIK